MSDCLGKVQGMKNRKDDDEKIVDDDVSCLIVEVMDELKGNKTGESFEVVSSGFGKLDNLLGEFKPGTLSVIASYPTVGKTALAISLAVNMAFGKNPIPIGYFSLETDRKQVIQRMISDKTQIGLEKIRSGNLNSDEFKRTMKAASEMYSHADHVYMYDALDVGIYELSARIRVLVREHGVKVVFIDNIDLIDADPREETLNKVSKALKVIAREFLVSIICTCPIAIRGRNDRLPALSDLRDGGFLDQYADAVILIDNPSLRFSGKERDSDFQECRYLRKIIIAKNRNGKVGAFNMHFDESCCLFVEE